MNCWHCGTELIWGGDHDTEDNEDYDITRRVVETSIETLEYIEIIRRSQKYHRKFILNTYEEENNDQRDFIKSSKKFSINYQTI